jgi:hypothetical protein
MVISVWNTTMAIVVFLIIVGFIALYFIAKKIELEKILIIRSVNFIMANLIILFVFMNGLRESPFPSGYDLAPPSAIIVFVIVPYVLLLSTSIFVKSEILNIIMLVLGAISVVVILFMVSVSYGFID